jgi:hypothetical protein
VKNHFLGPQNLLSWGRNGIVKKLLFFSGSVWEENQKLAIPQVQGRGVLCRFFLLLRDWVGGFHEPIVPVHVMAELDLSLVLYGSPAVL